MSSPSLSSGLLSKWRDIKVEILDALEFSLYRGYNLNSSRRLERNVGGILAEKTDEKEIENFDLDLDEDIDDELKEKLVSRLKEGKRMEAYAEHRTKDMNHCEFCETITYKKRPGKEIGKKWICIDCLRRLKEILENLDKWEEELALGGEMEDQIDKEMGL